MLKTWPVFLNDFLITRTIELHEHFLPHDQEHSHLQNEYCHTMSQLTARLDPEEYELFLDFESAGNSLMCKDDELIYKQGLIDGLRLGDYIDRIRRGKGQGG